MKISLSIVVLISFFNLNYSAEKTRKSTITAYSVSPNETDVDYLENQNKHYVVQNNKQQLGKLILFIGGSGSDPKNYNLICDFNAKLGFDVISLSYLNSVPASELANSFDNLIFDNYREEICFGTQISQNVNVDSLNSIATRTLKLLTFLSQKYPSQNWNNYLTNTNTINWDKITVAGHSQGAGHACYLAKKNSIERVVMFAGPNDYNTNLKVSANWLSVNGKTSLNNYYALLHEKDEIIKYEYQVSNLRSLGLLIGDDQPYLADNVINSFGSAHVISVKIKGLSYHNCVVGKNKTLAKIWTYLFTGK